jgi:hypothetical protein
MDTSCSPRSTDVAGSSSMPEWAMGSPFAITVIDRDGIIIAMNARAGETFARDGGLALVGKSLFDCHPPRANEQIRAMLRDGLANSYTIEKKGVKKLIHQAPWYRDGQVAGLVELSIVLPADLPHFVRQP